MFNLNLSNKKINNDSNIGAIICRTPKSLSNIANSNADIDNKCVLINSVEDLINTFGDPFIDPSSYSDLILAYNLVKANIPVYISSIYEMKDNDDEFDIQYNGYTEFTFKDKYNHNTITYKLKSDIKFCQPIIQSTFNINTLDIYVSLYYLDRSLSIYNRKDLYCLKQSQLYKILRFTYNINNATDDDIISDFRLNGLELKLYNTPSQSKTAFIDTLKQYSTFKVLLATGCDNNGNMVHQSDEYYYNINTNDYNYNFNITDEIINAYKQAIDALSLKLPAPHLLCLGKLYKSTSMNSANDNYIMYAKLNDLEPESYIVIQNYLLSRFDNECDTYLYINTPDVSASTVTRLLSNNSEYEYSYSLLDNYNCDLFFGYAYENINNSLYYSTTKNVNYSTAVLVWYSLLMSQQTYKANSIDNLNISNNSIKLLITKYTADILNNLRCNPIVTFDTGFPSIYGDRSLSNSANLKYSHISRTYIQLRRLIREYLQTQCFKINNLFNTQTYVNYISSSILDTFVNSGILSDYNIDYNINNKSVEFNITLLFASVIEELTLNFTI